MLITLMNAQEQEWARVSRLLHDEVGQILSAVGLQLDVLRMDYKDQVSDVEQRTSEIQKLLERAISHVRELSYELNPAIVEKAGFQFALERLIGRYRKKFPGTIRLMMDLAERLPHKIAQALYRIADQGVANAVAHAQTSQIEVLVKPSQRGVILELKDQGVGFPVEEVRGKSRGLGLLLMEHYASEAGIQLTFSSSPGSGTTVRAAWLPRG
jgi:signal transduction histidine kinase